MNQEASMAMSHRMFNTVRTSATAARVLDLESEQKYIWQDDAACSFQPSTLFEVAFAGDLVADGLGLNEIRDLNAVNLEAAKKICDSCPVWHLCYSAADENDFQFTVRAGITPLRFNATPQGRPSGAAPKPVKVDVCKRGHEDWIVKGGRRRCRACININQRARNYKARDGRVDGRSKPANARTTSSVCGECGASKWMARPDGGLRCQPCALDKQRARRRRGGADRVVV